MVGPHDFSLQALHEFQTKLKPDKAVALIDSCFRDNYSERLAPLREIVPEPMCLYLNGGEDTKTLGLVREVALRLNDCKVTRRSLLYVVGGGSLLDFGGFLAAVYKRGIAVAYIPPTLMAMVDAAYGGKTAINAGEVKNLLGIFKEPDAIFLDESFLDSLSDREILSGYAEIVKYALLEDETFFGKVLSTDPLTHPAQLRALIDQCIHIKKRFVEADPLDLGTRQALNVGHTVGHALEGYSHATARPGLSPLRHGEAVLIGIIVELYIAHKLLGFPAERLQQIIAFSREYFSPFLFECKQYDAIIKLMAQDKKNSGDDIAVLALRRIGEPIKINVSRAQLRNAFDFYREVIGG